MRPPLFPALTLFDTLEPLNRAGFTDEGRVGPLPFGFVHDGF